MFEGSGLKHRMWVYVVKIVPSFLFLFCDSTLILGVLSFSFLFLSFLALFSFSLSIILFSILDSVVPLMVVETLDICLLFGLCYSFTLSGGVKMDDGTQTLQNRMRNLLGKIVMVIIICSTLVDHKKPTFYPDV